LTALESTLASRGLGFLVLFHAFSTFFMKSMKKVEKAPKSKQGVFLMLQCWTAKVDKFPSARTRTFSEK